jgi:hypothetical protein
MSKGQAILQKLSQILSKLICSPTHRDNFMEPLKLYKNIIIFLQLLRQLYENPLEL